MTWAEFRQWAWDAYQYRMVGGHHRIDYAWTVVIGGSAMRSSWAREGPGSGNYIEYGVPHQRRFATWLRAKDLIHPHALMTWVDIAESHDDGWLINTGTGIRWISHADLIDQAPAIAARGLPLVGVRCGI